MASKSLTFDIYGRDKTASKTMKGIGANADSLGKRFQSVAKGIGIAAAAGLAALSVAAIAFANESVKAFAEAEQQQRKLEDAFERFPALADTNIEAIRKMNEALAKKTRFDDDAIAVGQAQLAQYGITGDQLKDLTPLLLDYAARTGKDVAGAAEDLGKALLGQGRALKAVGIDFQDTGSVAGNLAQLMAGLGSQVSGFAEKDAATAAGQLEILRNRFGELQEKIGEALMPALQGLMDMFEQDVMPVLEGFADWFVSDGLPGIQGFIGYLNDNKDTLIPIAVGIGAITAALWGLNAALAANPIVLAVGAILAAAAVSAAIITWMVTDWEGYIEFVRKMDDTVSGIWEGFVAFLLGIVAQVTAAIAGMIGSIGASFANGWAQIQSFVGMIGSAVAGMVASLVSTVAGLPGRIGGIFANAGSWLYSAGRDIVMGLVNGIGAAIGAAASAAARLAAQVVESAKSALGIKSPSRVFRDIGINVGKGYIGGLESQMRPVMASVGALVSPPAAVSAGSGTISNSFSLSGLTVVMEIGGQKIEGIIRQQASAVVSSYEKQNQRESVRGSSGF